MQPSLSLNYSSQAPIYGGLAAGWSLGGVHEIAIDRSVSRLRYDYLTHGDPLAFDPFVSTMAGGRPLVRITWGADPVPLGVYAVYRAQADDSYAIYHRMPSGAAYAWRVLASDGVTHYFGETSRVDGEVHVSRAPLTRSTDVFGNSVEYEWQNNGDTYELQRIKYTTHPSLGGGGQWFADIDFNWRDVGLCPNTPPSEDATPGTPIGASVDWRTGKRWRDGNRRLDSIVAIARDPSTGGALHTRFVTLSYDSSTENCSESATHAPFRQLASIQESAWGDTEPRVDLPAVTFQYGSPTVAITSLEPPSPDWFWNDYVLANQKNLGWGYRFQDSSWPTVEAMMLDWDGDGDLDRLTNVDPGATTCRVRVEINEGADGFVTATEFPMPASLPWKDGVGPDPAFPAFERCALNYQRTAFTNLIPSQDGSCPEGDQPPGSYLAIRYLDVHGDGLPDLVMAIHAGGNFDPNQQEPNPPEPGTPGSEYDAEPFGPWPSCTDAPACPAMESECINGAVAHCSLPGGEPLLCEMDESIATACLESAEMVPCHHMSKSIDSGVDCTPTEDGENPCANVDDPCKYHKPQMRCERYPWAVYRNLGNGQISTTPEIIYQPAQLESDSGDSSMVGGYQGSVQGFTDIDGDSKPDYLTHLRYAGGQSQAPVKMLWVLFGDGNGQLGASGGTLFLTPHPGSRVSEASPDYDVHPSSLDVVTRSISGFADLHGDGLPDYWGVPAGWTSQPWPTDLHVFVNDGLKLRTFGTIGSDVRLSDELDFQSKTHVHAPTPNDFNCFGDSCFVFGGTRHAAVRPVDVDYDGRADLVVDTQISVHPNIGPFPVVHFGTGDSVLETASNVTHLRDAATLTLSSALIWETSAGIVDMDGDGLLERWHWYGGTQLFRHSYQAWNDPENGPPRLMRAIDNGRGGSVKVAYAPMSNPDVVAQHPELNTQGFPERSTPKGHWVVKSMTIEDDFSPADSTTSYEYISPRFGPDDEGRYSFRGFASVRTTSPSGSITEQHYSYDPDLTGRLAKTITIPAEDTDTVHSMSETTWTAFSLFAGAIKTFHPTRVRTWTCSNGQTLEACELDPAATTFTDTTWSPKASSSPAGGPDLAYVPTVESRQASATWSSGDRKTITSFDLYTQGDTYRLRPRVVESMWRNGAVDETFAKSETTWDAAYKQVATEETWFSSDPATRAITVYGYDELGNRTTIRKPAQQAAIPTGPSMQLVYDANKLFVDVEINEKGHEHERDYEPGTGVLIAERGPNIRQCSSDCPPDPPPPAEPLPLKEERRTKVDGLGRPLSREVTIAYGAGSQSHSFKFSEIETFSYVDAATALDPTSVTNRKRIEHDETRWTNVKTELDGRGRPIKTIEETYGTAPVDAVSTFSYDAAGKLVAVSVPDASLNDASQVLFTYFFDSLGRPTAMRRPDAPLAMDRSGIDISYDGLVETRQEVVGAAGGMAAKTETEVDRWGRLVRVSEQLVAGTADTFYDFSPRDEVRQITDPEDVVTLLDHDWASRRTKITRGTREWKYTYDRNGNLLCESTPPPTPLDQPAYTTCTAYDDLDRMTSRDIAPRDLSLADRTLFGIGTLNFVWDGSVYNRMGRLVYFNRKDPDGEVVYTGRYFYDAEGNPRNEDRTYEIAGVQLDRGVLKTWSTFRKISSVQNADGIPGENNTTTKTIYDDRGNPLKLNLSRPGINNNKDIAVQTRNVAGLVSKRRTTHTASIPMAWIESNWSYDKLGRVTQQLVQKQHLGGTVEQIARQDLAYWGADDPRSLDHWIGSVGAANHKRFEFGYDLRHQLTSVDDTLAGSFTGGYSTGDAGRLTGATVAALPLPGSEVKPRSVEYRYDGIDAEQVTSLRINGTTNPWSTYAYDLAGNQTQRVYKAGGAGGSSDQTWTFVYDGEDTLRRVIAPDGSKEEYWYDHEDMRGVIRKLSPAGTVTEHRMFFGDTEITFDATGTITQTYAHASLGTPAARIENRNDRTEYQFHGLASSTLAAVESGVGDTSGTSGTTNVAFVYGPFGELVESSGAGNELTAHRRRMNDKYHDPASSLAYYGFRYYDQVLLGWSQADPSYRFAPDAAWKDPRRAALYLFNLNNPVRYLDPDGHDPVKAAKAVIGAFDSICGGCATAANNVITSNIEYGIANSPQVPDIVIDVAQVAAGFAVGGGIGGVAVLIGNTMMDDAQTPTASGDGMNLDVPDAPGRISSSVGGGAAPKSGNSDYHLPGDVPNGWVVVRGGEGPMKEPGTIFSAAFGKDIVDAGTGVPHGKVRETTAGEIRANGGDVMVAPEVNPKTGRKNYRHANVCEGGSTTCFSDVKDNPVPKKERQP